MNSAARQVPDVKPMGGDQFFEDFAIGERLRGTPVTLSEADILEFADRYDAQPFHIDPRAAVETHFGGLIASGIQVLAVTFGALIRAGFLKGGGMGSPGLDEVRWHKPVRPGDTIVMEAEVTAAKPSETRDDRGYVTLRFEVFNQRRECVMSYFCIEILRRRAAVKASTAA